MPLPEVTQFLEMLVTLTKSGEAFHLTCRSLLARQWLPAPGYDLRRRTNSPNTSLSLAELNDALLLPAILAPTFAEVTDLSVHLWSSPLAAEAPDLGPLADPSALQYVEAPALAGRVYVFDPTTATYGCIDADSPAPVELGLTP